MARTSTATPAFTTVPTSLLGKLDYYLTDFWAEHGDPRSADYPLMSTFKYALTFHFTYYFLVLYLGPRLMKNREPFNLRWLIIPYNLAMSLFNAYCFCRLLVSSRFAAELFDLDFNSKQMRRATRSEQNLLYLYWLSKYLDMLDSLFFILRKKYNQVSGLHVYHHSMVPLMGWIYFRTKIEHVSAGAFSLLNTPVHTIMYAYYGLAAIGPHMQPYLWWKRYITQIQIVQFVILLSYGLYFSLFNVGYHPFFAYDVLIQTPLYLYLFTRFYLNTYKNASEQKKKRKNDSLKCLNENGSSSKKIE